MTYIPRDFLTDDIKDSDPEPILINANTILINFHINFSQSLVKAPLPLQGTCGTSFIATQIIDLLLHVFTFRVCNLK